MAKKSKRQQKQKRRRQHKREQLQQQRLESMSAKETFLLRLRSERRVRRDSAKRDA